MHHGNNVFGSLVPSSVNEQLTDDDLLYVHGKSRDCTAR